MTISEYIASGRNVEKLNLDDINYLKNDETVKPMLKYLGNKMVDLLIERGLSESDKSEYLKGKMNATLEIIKEFE